MFADFISPCMSKMEVKNNNIAVTFFPLCCESAISDSLTPSPSTAKRQGSMFFSYHFAILQKVKDLCQILLLILSEF